MIFTIIIIVFTIVALMALHELGHFLVAKKFGVKVEEFGIGYPPRIFGRKFGQTIYSLNWLPFGAFVKILGEEERIKDPASFSQKPLYQRALILFAGVGAFWLVAFFILTITLTFFGSPIAIDDYFQGNFKDPRVIISYIQPESPAEIAGLKIADQFIGLKSQEEAINQITLAKQTSDFIKKNYGQEIIATVKRQNENIEITLPPRELAPDGQALIGIGLLRVAYVKYPWYEAPGRSALAVYQATIDMPTQMVDLIAKKLKGERVVGAEVVGPVGLAQMLGRSFNKGAGDFLSFIALISVWLAIFNLLPIPALDGGQLMFLGVEAIRKKPLPQKIERKITTAFFFALIGLMLLVTIRDITKLF